MIAPIENTVPKLLLTLPEAGQAMSCCERTVSRLVAKGELKSVRIGPRGVRIPVASINEWIQREAAK